MYGAVAKRYAAALFEIALDQGRMQEIDRQAQLVEPLFKDRMTRDFFLSPRISPEDKKRVVESRLADKLDRMLINLIKLLIDKRRISFLPEIMRYFDYLTDQKLGVEDAVIVSAVPLSDAQREAILSQVKRFSSYGELRVRYEVDTGVLGGVKVRLGENLVLDGTLSSKLAGMRQRMLRYQHRGIGV